MLNFKKPIKTSWQKTNTSHIVTSPSSKQFYAHLNLFNLLIVAIVAIRGAYSILANAVQLKGSLPDSAIGPSGFGCKTVPTLSQTEYPAIKFWNYSDWSASKNSGVSGDKVPGKRGGIPGVNSAQRFIEDVDGNVVSGDRAKDIRTAAHDIFHTISQSKTTVLPTSWGVAGLSLSNAFNNELAYQCPELQLCANHWKARQLATNLYPPWYNTYGPKVKTEATEPALATSSKSGLKRSRLESDAGNGKVKAQERIRKKGKQRASPLTVQIGGSQS